MLVLHFNPTAQNLQQVRDNLALEYSHIIRLQAVQDLPTDGHNTLELCIPALPTCTRCGITFHGIDFPAACVF